MGGSCRVEPTCKELRGCREFTVNLLGSVLFTPCLFEYTGTHTPSFDKTQLGEKKTHTDRNLLPECPLLGLMLVTCLQQFKYLIVLCCTCRDPVLWQSLLKYEFSHETHQSDFLSNFKAVNISNTPS